MGGVVESVALNVALHRRPILSLCVMVIKYQQYASEGEKVRKPQHQRQAVKIAKDILNFLKVSVPDAEKEVGQAGYNDPGPSINIRHVFWE